MGLAWAKGKAAFSSGVDLGNKDYFAAGLLNGLRVTGHEACAGQPELAYLHRHADSEELVVD